MCMFIALCVTFLPSVVFQTSICIGYFALIFGLSPMYLQSLTSTLSLPIHSYVDPFAFLKCLQY